MKAHTSIAACFLATTLIAPAQAMGGQSDSFSGITLNLAVEPISSPSFQFKDGRPFPNRLTDLKETEGGEFLLLGDDRISPTPDVLFQTKLEQKCGKSLVNREVVLDVLTVTAAATHKVTDPAAFDRTASSVPGANPLAKALAFFIVRSIDKTLRRTNVVEVNVSGSADGVPFNAYRAKQLQNSATAEDIKAALLEAVDEAVQKINDTAAGPRTLWTSSKGELLEGDPDSIPRLTDGAPTVTNDGDTAIDVAGVAFGVIINNSVPRTPDASLEPAPSAISISMASDVEGSFLQDVKGTITFPDGRTLQPTGAELLNGMCDPDWQPRNVISSVGESPVLIAIHSSSTAQTCLRLQYSEFIRPNQNFYLAVGTLKNSKGATKVTMAFHPVIKRVALH